MRMAQPADLPLAKVGRTNAG